MRTAALATLGVFSFIIVCLWGGDVLADRSIALAVVSPAPLYSLAPTDYPPSNPVILTISPGQRTKVLRMRYGKDFQAFRVETENGSVGWVVGGEGIKIESGG